ncbi:hypothetical protein AAFF_G00265150 [Aldrovandia affinis]|uniref:Uncharacterized protein n=1 Tax=Aldrovandia affinis TaxID=143900 RepID=A0AAD7RC55_9TELE|nr:hypothetical protein AAFF_G00265150 [Aldrovandia affinis]
MADKVALVPNLTGDSLQTPEYLSIRTETLPKFAVLDRRPDVQIYSTGGHVDWKASRTTALRGRKARPTRGTGISATPHPTDRPTDPWAARAWAGQHRTVILFVRKEGHGDTKRKIIKGRVGTGAIAGVRVTGPCSRCCC